MSDVIEKLLMDYRSKHSEFQIDNFIIGNQGCVWSEYKQALREIHGRYISLISQKEDLEMFDLKKSWRWPFGRRSSIIKSRRERSRFALANGISETERELDRFVELAVELKKEIGDIDPVKRQVLEADSWLQKSVRMAAVDLIVNGRIGQSTIGMIISLPTRDRAVALDKIKGDPHKLIGL
jgi:hypothetical protein